MGEFNKSLRPILDLDAYAEKYSKTINDYIKKHILISTWAYYLSKHNGQIINTQMLREMLCFSNEKSQSGKYSCVDYYAKLNQDNSVELNVNIKLSEYDCLYTALYPKDVTETYTKIRVNFILSVNRYKM